MTTPILYTILKNSDSLLAPLVVYEFFFSVIGRSVDSSQASFIFPQASDFDNDI